MNKPHIKPAPASVPHQIILNQHTFSQLTPQQRQRILAQNPGLRQLFLKTQLASSKRKRAVFGAGGGGGVVVQMLALEPNREVDSLTSD